MYVVKIFQRGQKLIGVTPVNKVTRLVFALIASRCLTIKAINLKKLQ